jgi:hypothetical protein
MWLRTEMKHGDKAKKSAKAVQASGKKGSSHEVVAKARKEGGASSQSKTSGKEAGPKTAGKKTGGEAAAKAPAKTVAAKAPAKVSEGKAVAGNGKNKAVDTEGPAFANPLVAASFKRAVKKYPNAFRRLTD